LLSQHALQAAALKEFGALPNGVDLVVMDQQVRRGGGGGDVSPLVPDSRAVVGGPLYLMEELLHANWRVGEFFTADGQLLRANLPSFTPDPSLGQSTADQETEDGRRYQLFRDQADHWTYPASAPPSFQNGTHLCAAVVQARSDEKEDLNDFVIRVCVYLTGADSETELISKLKSAASRLDDETHKSITTWLIKDRENFVSKILKCDALLQAAGMQASDVDGLCDRYTNFMKSGEKFSSFSTIARSESPWLKRVTLPLFNPVSDAGSDHWLNAWNVKRFLHIFAHYLRQCTAEVRLLPPWGSDAFGPSFQEVFWQNSQDPEFYCIDRVFSPWLFQRSADDRLKRKTGGVEDFVTAVSLVTFSKPACDPAPVPASTPACPRVVVPPPAGVQEMPPNTYRYLLSSQYENLEAILGTFFPVLIVLVVL
jgi:hypothetical protein